MLPPDVRRRVAVEAGSPLGWERWVGDEGAIIGLDHFGASAPAEVIFERFGFSVDRVADIARKVVREGLHGLIPTLEPGHLPAAGAAHEPRATKEQPEGQNGGTPERAGLDRTDSSDPGHS